MDELQPKISELSQIQLEQREEGERMTEETLELVQRYNDIIASLSEAFITADQVVSKAEEELNIKWFPFWHKVFSYFQLLNFIRGAKGTPLPWLYFAQLAVAFSCYHCYEKCYIHTNIHTNGQPQLFK